MEGGGDEDVSHAGQELFCGGWQRSRLRSGPTRLCPVQKAPLPLVIAGVSRLSWPQKGLVCLGPPAPARGCSETSFTGWRLQSPRRSTRASLLPATLRSPLAQPRSLQSLTTARTPRHDLLQRECSARPATSAPSKETFPVGHPTLLLNMARRRLRARLVCLATALLPLLGAAEQTPFSPPSDCIDSATAAELNQLLRMGGAGTAVVLCPDAHISVRCVSPNSASKRAWLTRLLADRLSRPAHHLYRRSPIHLHSRLPRRPLPRDTRDREPRRPLHR